MNKILLLALVVALVLAVAAPGIAAHDPNATGCARAHECFSDVAHWFPENWPEDQIWLMVWNPQSGGYESAYAYDLASFCYNYGGYWYLDIGGDYWNAC